MTTRAVKLKRRPPLTTLATRLMVTTRSTKLVRSPPWRLSRPPWRSRRSPPLRWGPGMFRTSLCSRVRLEGEPAGAGALCDGGHAAVVAVATAVEDHGLDPRGLGALADLAGLGGLVVGRRPQVALHRGRRGQRAASRVVDHLDEQVA